MRKFSCVVLLLAAFGANTCVGEEPSETVSKAGTEPGGGSPSLKSIAASWDGKPPVPLCAHVYRLEGATNIALDAKVINEWGSATLTSPSDGEFEAFLRKLQKAKVIHETNSVSFFVTDRDDGTPVLCRRDVMIPDGMQSFEAAFGASVLSPGNEIRISLQLHDTIRRKGREVHSREIDTGFDIGPKQGLVYRAKYPKHGDSDGEWLIWITRGMIRPTSYSWRGFIPASSSTDSVSSTSSLSPQLVRYIEELPPPRPRVTR
jgi:hypothetical protein